MDENLLLIIAFVLIWISGLLAGLGFKRKSLERKIRENQTGQADGKAKNELPMTQVEVG